MTARWITADVFDGLTTLDDGSVDLVVTSPPFLALRSYLPADHPDKGKEIGSESTPAEFVDVLLRVTAELRRVLAPHGSICIELGDTYAGSGGGGGDYYEGGLREGQPGFTGSAKADRDAIKSANAAHWRQKNPQRNQGSVNLRHGVTIDGKGRLQAGEGWPLAKSKTLIPELYRLALAYGINPLTGQPSPAGRWRIRNVVTWCRPNPPVGALGDKWRPATSDVVVACVSDKRYWDDIATRREFKGVNAERQANGYHHIDPKYGRQQTDGPGRGEYQPYGHSAGAPLLDYWEIPPGGYPGAHYAVFPPALVEPLIKAMAPPKVCRTCGEPSRRITKDRSAFDVQPLLAAHIKERREALNLTSAEINDWFGFKEIAKNWERTDTHGAAIPNAEVWPVLKERLGLSDEFDDVVLGERRWTEDPAEYVGGELKPRRTGDFMGSGSHTKVDGGITRMGKTLGWSDCGHDDLRPSLILDPFGGSGTVGQVATGHGHDCILIDLDERNAVLAEERIGPFLFEQATA